MDIRVDFNFTVWNQILHYPNSGLIKYKAKRTDSLWYTLSTHVVLQIISSIYFVLKGFYVPRINHNHISERLIITFSSCIFFLGVECRSSSSPLFVFILPCSLEDYFVFLCLFIFVSFACIGYFFCLVSWVDVGTVVH